MNDIKSLSHTKWECEYHLTWIPKYRKKQIYGDLRNHRGEVIRELARRADCEIEEGHVLPDHAHMLISIPPKYSVSKGVHEGQVFILHSPLFIVKNEDPTPLFSVVLCMMLSWWEVVEALLPAQLPLKKTV